MAHRPIQNGFTLIELMIVVAIIGLLAAISMPKFASLVTRAKEAAVKGKLGAVRSALSIYYADNEGFYPYVGIVGLSSNLSLTPKYIETFPSIAIPTVPFHANSGVVYGDYATYLSNAATFDSVFSVGSRLAWIYNSASGQLFVNCTHADSRGTTWTQY